MYLFVITYERRMIVFKWGGKREICRKFVKIQERKEKTYIIWNDELNLCITEKDASLCMIIRKEVANCCNCYKNKSEVTLLFLKKGGLWIADLNGKGGWFKCQPLKLGYRWRKLVNLYGGAVVDLLVNWRTWFIDTRPCWREFLTYFIVYLSNIYIYMYKI